MHTSAICASSFGSDMIEATADRTHLFDENMEQKPKEPMNKAQAINLGQVLYPLFCVSVHEHAWMSAGYGVWGKEKWLSKFWTVLDWQKVSSAYSKVYKDPHEMLRK